MNRSESRAAQIMMKLPTILPFKRLPTTVTYSRSVAIGGREKRDRQREGDGACSHLLSFILEVVSEDRSNYWWHFRGIYCYLARFTVGMKPPEARVHSFIELLKEGTSVTEPYFHLCVFSTISDVLLMKNWMLRRPLCKRSPHWKM